MNYNIIRPCFRLSFVHFSFALVFLRVCVCVYARVYTRYFIYFFVCDCLHAPDRFFSFSHFSIPLCPLPTLRILGRRCTYWSICVVAVASSIQARFRMVWTCPHSWLVLHVRCWRGGRKRWRGTRCWPVSRRRNKFVECTDRKDAKDALSLSFSFPLLLLCFHSLFNLKKSSFLFHG